MTTEVHGTSERILLGQRWVESALPIGPRDAISKHRSKHRSDDANVPALRCLGMGAAETCLPVLRD
jgi:hypothetical protein